MSTIGVRGGKNPTKEFWPIQLQLPKAYTADGNGLSVDRFRNGGYFALTLMLLPGLWTDGTHDFYMEEADDSGGSPGAFTAVAAGDLLGGGGTAGSFVSITAATTTVQRVDYIGRKRYVRVRYDYTAGSTGAVFAVVALLFSPTVLPAA